MNLYNHKSFFSVYEFSVGYYVSVVSWICSSLVLSLLSANAPISSSSVVVAFSLDLFFLIFFYFFSSFRAFISSFSFFAYYFSSFFLFLFSSSFLYSYASTCSDQSFISLEFLSYISHQTGTFLFGSFSNVFHKIPGSDFSNVIES